MPEARQRWLAVAAAMVALVTVSGVYVKTSRVESPSEDASDDGLFGRSPGLAVDRSGGDGLSAETGLEDPAIIESGASRRTSSRRWLECGSSKGGSRAGEPGVSATQIRLGAVVAESGIMSSVVGEARYGMEAIRQKINQMGGICGREVVIDYVDAGGDSSRGAAFMCKMAEEVFAFAVVPDFAAIPAAIESGCIDRLGVPIVGTFGLTTVEFSHRLIWPVGAPGSTFAHAMVADAYRRGARRFGITFNNQQGLEFRRTAEAYNEQVRRRTGRDVDGYNPQGRCVQHYCGTGGSSLGPNPSVFAAEPVDVTALAMFPYEALAWLNDPDSPGSPTRRYEGVHTMMSRGFAINCQQKCDGMRVWTPYEVPVGGSKQTPAVREYVERVQRTNPQADIYNGFVQDAYLGMMVLADAMAHAGVDLTRKNLAAVLDMQSFETGLTRPIRFGGFPWRTGHRCLHAYEIQYKGSFQGWKPASDWICVPGVAESG